MFINLKIGIEKVSEDLRLHNENERETKFCLQQNETFIRFAKKTAATTQHTSKQRANNLMKSWQDTLGSDMNLQKPPRDFTQARRLQLVYIAPINQNLSTKHATTCVDMRYVERLVWTPTRSEYWWWSDGTEGLPVYCFHIWLDLSAS